MLTTLDITGSPVEEPEAMLGTSDSVSVVASGKPQEDPDTMSPEVSKVTEILTDATTSATTATTEFALPKDGQQLYRINAYIESANQENHLGGESSSQQPEPDALTISNSLPVPTEDIQVVSDTTDPITPTLEATTMSSTTHRPRRKPAPNPDEGKDAKNDVKPEDNEPFVKGITACSTKEEVVAPYWANNTRGEILALLNVYPFEQFIHSELCAFPNKQMLCRKGCRCEQQFRLHRLLAFDPKDECRGVFSDWFKFPSGCVCICYELGGLLDILKG